MSTFEDRHRNLMHLTGGEDLGVADSFRAIYHWMRFEFALFRIDQATRTMHKHAAEYNKLTDIANFRRELQDL